MNTLKFSKLKVDTLTVKFKKLVLCMAAISVLSACTIPGSVSDTPYTYCASVAELAAAVDFLIVATPGGSDTRHLVDAPVLDALGPHGYLINIARGSVIDTDALIAALASARIAGAGLDVFDHEPQVPDALKTLGNVVMTPHMGGQSPEAAQGTVQLVVNNLLAYFSGQPVLTPVRLPTPV